ncbi:transcription factor TFIIIC subunit TFC4 NDAI_0B05320 [Naumovozyma dairenensis CBS 421]|uniref:Transcription factor tau 131 kDa subunit n=1 Tax=Naumovozyma dairenensis (strain ATCC 10597 / BCRC 20456 / CBS 421 / NBRC 0211 / NRRL Y-12639) TaxID=1071378 RepID=G0W704_NAUDC|nr:hypothetical protein NDAI_0B05320 [Naumovozyma dairenensis CBS 421]CCD23565.1 hypothetical protein NDAI_0B05320 [Naumovozyma dairenensis CBS 421]
MIATSQNAENESNIDIRLTDDHEHEEESLYGDVDDLRLLINDSDNDMNDNGDGLLTDEESMGNESLLAEFSDNEEISEDDEQNFMDAIREANNFKVKNKNKNGKKSKRKGGLAKMLKERVLDPEVAQLLSEANEAFVRSDLQVAERLYNEVIKKDARNFAAYETLGEIYQLQGRLNDCCNSWFLAAHINSTDWEFWKVVAILSADLDHIRQAIYCFSRVCALNHEEWESLYRRSLLYKKIGQIGRALEGFQKLYSHNPFNSNILRELAVLYVDYDRIEDAIDLYIKIFEANVARREAIVEASENAIESSDEEGEDEKVDDNSDEEEEEEDGDEDMAFLKDNEDMQLYPGVNWKKLNSKHKCLPFDWSSLNIMTELYLKLPIGGSSGINTIKKCARWIERRENQIFWDDVTDDSEFDDRRFKNGRFDALPQMEKDKKYFLPIDIRVRLGLLRLENEHYLEAMTHFQYLYDEDFEEIADLYFEVALALTKMEKYQEAIDFFLPLLNVEDYQSIELYEPLGRCYKETEQYALAKDYYETVVEMDGTNVENILMLAEITYQLGNTDMFKELLARAKDLRKEQEDEYIGSMNKPIEEVSDDGTTSKPLLEDSLYRKASYKKKKTPQDAERERIDRERKIVSKVLKKYKRLDALNLGLEQEDPSAITAWIDTVFDLVDVFSSVKNFFMKSRSKKFVGIIRRTKNLNTVVDYKIERLSKLSEGDVLSDEFPLLDERVILTSTTELRGLTYDQWFELFMKLALTIARYQSIEDAISVIETAQDVNVFNQDPERVKMMKFIKLAIILQDKNQDEETITEHLRGLLNQFQFNRKVFQIFCYCLCKGRTSLNIVSSTVQQKFFLRQLKAFDSLRYDTHVNGQASITNTAVTNPEKKSSLYLYYIYAVLLYSSRGFVSSLQYLSWLEDEIPDDPMVNLLMGLSHLHRSMQRLTAHRHFQILHGLRYLFRYHDIRSTKYTELEKQEADYNIGRAFHLIGLVSIAITYYDKVLNNYSEEKLKRHAAYNSIIIYQESGNIELANSLMRDYLTI